MPRSTQGFSTDMQLIAGETASGKPVTLLLNDDGSLPGGGGGGGDATAANQLDQIVKAEESVALQTQILGLNGSDFISDSIPAEGDYIALIAVTDCVIEVIVLTGVSSGQSNLYTVPLQAGQSIIVPFTEVLLTSGIAQAVKA